MGYSAAISTNYFACKEFSKVVRHCGWVGRWKKRTLREPSAAVRPGPRPGKGVTCEQTRIGRLAYGRPKEQGRGRAWWRGPPRGRTWRRAVRRRRSTGARWRRRGRIQAAGQRAIRPAGRARGPARRGGAPAPRWRGGRGLAARLARGCQYSGPAAQDPAADHLDVLFNNIHHRRELRFIADEALRIRA